MIGKLRGIVEDKEEDSVILDVGGVGYHVFCSARTLEKLAPNEAAQLTIETHVREDQFHLYGFIDSVEREWFRLLVTVQRVGNKMALQILSAYPPEQLAHAIIAKDTVAFTRIKGVGKGLAERIVTELKEKATKLPVGNANMTLSVPTEKKSASKATAPTTTPSAHEDAVSALVNLGYTRSEAYSAALKAAQVKTDVTLDELIRFSLKELVNG
ncbi:MAG: Holliday junction branch migration protein RuvA [Alphaproteobacteria bacterium]